jgi:16S rRNA pseudouridine516 synthase
MSALLEKAHDGAFITIYEGKFHQVKRMFEATDNKVLYLERLQMGNLCLDKALMPGEYRELTCDEIKLLCEEE